MTRTEKMTPAQRVTAAIVERLEKGVRPWAPSWTGGQVRNPLRVCGTPYRGINRLTLRMIALERGYTSPYWLTFHAALEAGGNVRKGEKGSLVVYSGRTTPRDATSPPTRADEGYEGTSPEDAQQRRADLGQRRSGGWFLSSASVFAAEQCDGLDPRFYPEPPPPQRPLSERVEEFEAWVKATGARVQHGGGTACYMPSTDTIMMPERSRFQTDDLWSATLSHELSHWSGAPNRLDRSFKRYHEIQARAAEELLAEVASANLGAAFGHPVEHLDDHSAYVGAWLSLLKGDDRAIISIASKAEAVADWLLRKGNRADLADELTGKSTEAAADEPALQIAA